MLDSVLIVHRPEADGLDEPPCPVDNRDIADPHLVFHHHEESADQVADEVLRAKAYGQPDNPGTGQDRGDVQPDLL
jgi:hypothetical protein